mmetsp:Transcript_1197/g.4041  ORF Transcript_1197/g.4041 Transcript_1197/m.4041 type:complete len:497 (+) Transcript_1197:200-1690(+)
MLLTVLPIVVTIYCAVAVGALVSFSRSKLPKSFWLPPPFPLLLLVFYPVTFWSMIRRVAERSEEGAALFQLLGMRGVLVEDRSLIRGTTRDGGKTFKIFAHPNARWLFYTATQQNLIILPNDLHATVRAQYQTFLSMDALTKHNGDDLYESQRAWLEATLKKKDTTLDVRVWSQSLLAHAILTNICPKFLSLPKPRRSRLCQDIQTFTMGFLSLPVPFKPFGLGRAIAAGERIIAVLLRWMDDCREKVFDAKEDDASASQEDSVRREFGFLGRWLLELRRTGNAIKFTDRDVAVNLLDMAFAAQDATNSALCFVVAFFAARPDVLSKLAGQGWQATDVCNFVQNILAAKPPVPMTLRVALDDADLVAASGKTVSVAKGDLVVHSIEGINQVWKDPAKFDFDPFATPADPAFVDSMVFGSGAHKCPGKSYALVALQTFVAAFADAVHTVTPVDYNPDLMYYPTLFPKKSTFAFAKRENTFDLRGHVVGDTHLGVHDN